MDIDIDSDKNDKIVLEGGMNLAEAPPKVMNFRHSIDIYNFYRFINDHDLRKEAKQILDVIVSRISSQRKKRKPRASKKNLQ